MAYYEPFNEGLRQPSPTDRLKQPLSRIKDAVAGFPGALKDSIVNAPQDLRAGTGYTPGAGMIKNVAPVAKMGLKVAKPIALGMTAAQVADTDTEEYATRLGKLAGAMPFTPEDTPQRLKGWLMKSDTNAGQVGKDVLTRGVGAAMDTANNLALGLPGALKLPGFAREPKAPTPTAQPQAPAPQPQAAPENVAGNGQPVVGGAFKTDGISPELQARMEKNGIKFDGAPDTPKTQERRAQTSGDMVGAERMKALGDVRVVGDTGVYSQQKPGQSPEFSNVSPFKDAGEMVNYAQATNKGMSGLRAYGGKGGTFSTVETGGAENYAKQLSTIQGLRGGLGPAGGQVSMIANPDKKAPPSALETVQNALNGMSGKLNASGLAAIVEAQKADQTAAIQRDSIAQRDRENTAQAAAKNTGPSFRDLLEAKKFQYQTGRDKLQDALALEGNDRNNRVAGANLAATGQSIEKGREDLTAKQFEALFRKKDEKGADVADTESISRFSGELAQAIATLANSGDKADVARFGIQHKKADGSLGLRAREWDELTGTDKNELVRGFKFSDHVKKYATDGDRGGNFGEYMRGRKDAQGRIVFGAGGKTRAIADEATLNSDGTTMNPLTMLDPFDKRSFGLGERRNRTEGFVK